MSLSEDELDFFLRTPADTLDALDRIDCEESLLGFVQRMWSILEPGRELAVAWPLEAMCEHLEAVSRGQIKRLLLNVSPGWMKSLLCNVFLPAWEWGPRNMPSLRYVNFSYSALLTERDNRRFRDVMLNHDYGRLFGDRFALMKTGEQLVSNDKTGWKLATSIDGVGTGERGDRVVCFPAETLVYTDRGALPIGHVVRAKAMVQAWSLGPSGLELKPVTGWHRNSGRKLLRLTLADGSSLVCTDDHRILSEKGYVRARDLAPGDHLYAAPSRMLVTSPIVIGPQRQVEMLPYAASSDSGNGLRRNAKLISEHLRRLVVATGDLPNQFFGEMRSAIFESAVAFAVGDVLSSSPILDIAQSGIGAIPVFMTDLLPFRTRTKERLSDHLVSKPVNRFAGDTHGDPRVSAIKYRREDAARYSHFQATPRHGSRDAADASEIGHFVGGYLNDVQPHLARLVVIEDAGHADETFCLTVAENHNMVCGEGDQVIVCSNCDDPHNVRDGESDAVRKSTVTWFREAMSNRLNDENSAIIVIMQRVHEEDVSGVILNELKHEYEHLMIPYEWEGSKLISTVPNMRWTEDPRTKLGEEAWPERLPSKWKDFKITLGPYACNPYEAPILMGDLTMKPIGEVRVGDEVVGFDKKKRADGKGRMKLTRSTVTEVQSRKAPVVRVTLESGEVIRCTPDHRWFRKDRGPDRNMYGPIVKGRTKLARVCPSKMPSLNDPEDIWAAGWLSGFFDGEGSVSLTQKKAQNLDGSNYRNGTIISFYQTAERNLPICDKLEKCLDRLGFDWTYGYKPRVEGWQVSRHYRLTGGNLPMYQRFLHVVGPTKWRDRILDGAFGSKFILGRERVVDVQPDGEETVYALTTTTGNYVAWGFASSNCASQYQQKPTPRGGGIFKRDWWQTWDPEPDAEGNMRFPQVEFVVASFDGAFGEKQENDYSALTVWGVFRKAPGILGSSDRVPRHYLEQINNSGQSIMINSVEMRSMRSAPRIILMHAWRKRLPLNGEEIDRLQGETDVQYRRRTMSKWGIVQWVGDTCRRFRVHRLLVEAKANGIDVANEVRRQYQGEGWGTDLIDPGRLDKVGRAYSVQHLWSDAMIYAPDKEWADEVIDEMAVFPKGGHDDYCDTATMAMKFLRDIGLAQHQFEVDKDFAQSLTYKPEPKPLYPA